MSKGSERLFEALGGINERKIEKAARAVEKTAHGKRWGRRGWLGAVAAVLAVAVALGAFLRPGGGLTAYAIARAEYPETAQRRELGDTSALEAFFARSTQTFLTEEPGENRVYSPLNVYLALSMLAQITGGDSRGQILALLGSGSMEELRGQASAVWQSTYRNGKTVTSILASSLWLNQNIKFNQDTMDALARDFYASSYAGEMGSKGFNRALQTWLNEQTGGLLEEQAGNVELDPTTILALVTTLYFKAPWVNEFSKDKTAPQTFHTPAGDVETDFLHQRNTGNYYWGDGFTAVSQSFEEGGSMWFLLPDEGVAPEELLAGGEGLDFLFAADKSQWERQKFSLINKSIPKFDVSSQFDLGDGLKALGVTDVYDETRSDFTPMTTDVNGPITLSMVNHAARVVIDEEGCTAAAFTVAAPGGDAAPSDEVDFVLDRPFLFCVTGDSGLPLFVGVVNYPGGN